MKFHNSSNGSGSWNNQIFIENLSISGNNRIAIDANWNTKLANSSTIDTWIFGNVVPGGYQVGQSSMTSRPASLLGANGKSFTARQPTYKEYAANQFVNMKAVPEFP